MNHTHSPAVYYEDLNVGNSASQEVTVPFEVEDLSEHDLCGLSEEPPTKRIKLEDSFTVCHMNHLPKEVLRHIFTFLFTNDKKSASLVCRAWLDVMDDRVLMAEITVKLWSWSPKFWDLDGRNVYFSRRFSDFVFLYADISSDFLKFLLEYGKSIKVLTFQECTLNQNVCQANDEKSYFSNLEKLKFTNCKLNIFHKMPVLKELHVLFYGNIILTNHDLVEWGKVMPKLESLKLDLCQQIKGCIYENSPGSVLQSQRAALTLPVLLDFIKGHHKTLTEIYVRDEYGSCSSKTYKEIFKMKELNLKNMYINNCILFDESHSTVIKIAKKFPTITDLELEKLSLSVEHLTSICTLLPNLVSFSITNCEGCASLKDVFRLKHLQNLSITYYSAGDYTKFEEVIGVYQLKELKHFKLAGTCIQTGTLMNLLSKMTELISLKLIFYDGVTDETVRHISEHLVRLRVLEIDSRHITDEGIFSSSNPKQCLSNIKGLRKLVMRHPKFSEEALVKAVKFLALNTLNICPRFSDLKSSTKDEIKKNNPSLRTVPEFLSIDD